MAGGGRLTTTRLCGGGDAFDHEGKLLDAVFFFVCLCVCLSFYSSEAQPLWAGTTQLSHPAAGLMFRGSGCSKEEEMNGSQCKIFRNMGLRIYMCVIKKSFNTD